MYCKKRLLSGRITAAELARTRALEVCDGKAKEQSCYPNCYRGTRSLWPRSDLQPRLGWSGTRHRPCMARGPPWRFPTRRRVYSHALWSCRLRPLREQVHFHQERDLRIVSFAELVTLLIAETKETSEGQGPLHWAVAKAVKQIVPALPSASPEQAQDLVRTYYDRLHQHRLIVELYQRTRYAYMDEAIPGLKERVDEALSETRRHPYRHAWWVARLPLRLLGLAREDSKLIATFDPAKIRTDLSEWSRIVDRHLLAHVSLMAKVAKTSPILRASAPKPALPSAVEPQTHGHELKLIEQAREQVQRDGVHWEKPEVLLRRARDVADETQDSAPHQATELQADVERWQRQLRRFPNAVFQELVDSEIEPSRWPRWFTDGIEASLAHHGVTASHAAHRRNCIRVFVLGDYTPDGIAPSEDDDEPQAPLDANVQPDLHVLPSPDPVEELF